MGQNSKFGAKASAVLLATDAGCGNHSNSTSTFGLFASGSAITLIPPNTLQLGDIIEVHIAGVLQNTNGGSAVTVRSKDVWNGTVVTSDPTAGITQDAVNARVYEVISVWRCSAIGASGHLVCVKKRIELSQPAAAGLDANTGIFNAGNTANVDTTAAITYNHTFAMSAAATGFQFDGSGGAYIMRYPAGAA